MKGIYKIVAVFAAFYSVTVMGQSELIEAADPFVFYDLPRYTLEEGTRFNQPEFTTHPDFGHMTFSAPYGKRVVEDISKRTPDERFYYDLDDATFFYIEKASQPINFYENGILRAIDYSLHPVNSFLYESGPQPVKTGLDLMNKRAYLKIDSDYIGLANIELEITHFDNSTTEQLPDWSQVTVGNFGVRITEIFPGIDLEIIFRQGALKTEFVIKQNPGVKELRFIDKMQLPEKYELITDLDPVLSMFVQIYNTETGETDVVIDPARTRDASGSRSSWINQYTIVGNNLKILVDSTTLNDASHIYPLRVDPLITAVGPVTSAFGIRGSLLSPSSCNHTITVSYPAGSTPWDVSANWSVYTDFCARTYILTGLYADCWMSDAQVWLTSACGGASPVGAPGTIWTCIGCNSIGTWTPTLAFGSSGTQSLAQCYPASCSAQNRSFTINDNRTFCSSITTGGVTYDNCTWANSYCISLDQWSVTVQGRTMETLGNTTTGNGSQTINDADCIGTSVLDPTPLYGIPTYTYSWSTGASSSTITVNNTPGVYTCTVTDACGTARIATFNIGCPLPITLSYFEGKWNGNETELKWEVLNEEGIEAYVVQRMTENGGYENLYKQESSGSSGSRSYLFKDYLTPLGKNFYRLQMISKEEGISYSETIEVNRTNEENIVIAPNPNAGEFDLFLLSSKKQTVLVEVLDKSGQIVYSSTLEVEAGQNKNSMMLKDLTPGLYVVRSTSEDGIASARLVIR